MHPNSSARECLRAGRQVFFKRPLPLILGWVIAAACVVLGIILFPSNLSLGLQVGAILSAPGLLWTQLVSLRGSLDESEEALLRGSLRDWGSSFLAAAVIPTVFRYATFWTWMAVPLSGGLMYTLHAWCIESMFMAGRMDLFITAVVFGFAGFMVSCGLFFSPLCAMRDSRGPFYAIARSWRMAGGQRLKILRIAVACFWIPVALFLPAYFLSVLRTSAAVFRGLPAVLWTISGLTVVLFLGPWFTGSLTALFIPLKAEEDEYMRRRAEKKATWNIR